MTSPLKIADVLAVRGGGLTATLIRIGEELAGKPALSNHIAVMHHWLDGVPWGLEGRPGGVGWVDLRRYIQSPLVLNNCGQPGRDDETRARVAGRAALMLGTAYDWQSIADDTLRAFHMPGLWVKDWHGQAPGHVVCSSYAAFLYGAEGWAHPGCPDRDTEPADWDQLILASNWNVPLR